MSGLIDWDDIENWGHNPVHLASWAPDSKDEGVSDQ